MGTPNSLNLGDDNAKLIILWTWNDHWVEKSKMSG